ncbi:hypothetical protein RJT34_33323 [Clitoria ternatea]|uniref:Bidirectional sugar transporter SWEET n=1 Tax=Clitoria ternatea TaxID=43366 RepID=A0AAN9EZQ4_CLITE
MVNAGTVRTAIGVVVSNTFFVILFAGNVISFCLFMSPVPTLIKICKSKSVQDFKPDPYIVTILNCAMWLFYGLPLVTPNNTLVITINGFGFFIEIVYTLIFFSFSKSDKKKKIVLAVAGEFIFIALVVCLVVLLVHERKKRALIVGVICVVFNILMYFSPLTVMRRVIRTKSVKYMPFLLSLANFLNGIVWTIYALLKWDPFIVVPNALGAVSGLVQLILYAIYYRTTNWNDEESPARASV